jgi:outer membrane protein OmpA-like peptidoglycan-associated protein
MKNLLYIPIFFTALAFPASAQDENSFQSVNDIVSQLNPLDVIANYGGVRRSIDLDIQFAFGSAQLLPAAKIQIKALAEALLSDRLNGYNIQIIGHTDASGNLDANQTLSLKRAQSVLTAISDGYGVNSSRLQAIGKGEELLIKGIAPDDAKHRRVEIVAVEKGASTSSEPDAEEISSDEALTSDKDGNLKINW